MKQNHLKKLSLNKKAISNLSVGQMRQVNGGGWVIPIIPTQICWITVGTNGCNPITYNCTPITLVCTVNYP